MALSRALGAAAQVWTQGPPGGALDRGGFSTEGRSEDGAPDLSVCLCVSCECKFLPKTTHRGEAPRPPIPTPSTLRT